MDTIDLIKNLKIVIQKLSAELEESVAKQNALEEGLRLSFPYKLYKQLRPDVVKVLGHEEKALLNHYLKYGIKSNVAIQEGLNELTTIMPQESLALQYARDLFELDKQLQRKAERNSILQLSKTSGTKVCIDSNQRHEFARKFTLMHLQSNSICTWIPKNSCSSLRYSIAVANGAISSLNDISWIHQNNKSFCASNKELLSAKYSFVFLRNPFKRILSFYLDKICHKQGSEEDKSRPLAQTIFNTGDNTSFKDFIDFISKNPLLIEEDIHTKKQCDFLVFSQYDDYFCLENYKDSAEKLKKKCGLELIDTRDANSIFTTKGLKASKQFTPDLRASEIYALLQAKIKPIAENMYTDEMIDKVANIYFADILLYMRAIDTSGLELDPWIKKLRTAQST